MSGSGSCVFAVVENMSDANLLAEGLKKTFSYVKACTTLQFRQTYQKHPLCSQTFCLLQPPNYIP